MNRDRVETALMTVREKRHPDLDPYAEIYQHAVALRATLDQIPPEAADRMDDHDDVNTRRLDGLLSSIAGAAITIAAAEHSDALEWTHDRRKGRT